MNADSPSSSSSASPSSLPANQAGPGERQPVGIRRLAWWVAGTLLALGAFWANYRQCLQVDPLRGPRSWTEWRWWSEPFQLNASFDLPNAGGRLDSVTATKAGQELSVIVSNQMLLRSSNGGRQWSEVKLPNPAGEALFAVFFLDAVNGWVSGKETIYRTADGGANWTRVTVRSPAELRTLQFSTPNDGRAWDGKEIFITADGGVNWKPLEHLEKKPGQFMTRHYYSPPDNRSWWLGAQGTLYFRNGKEGWKELPVVQAPLNAQILETYWWNRNGPGTEKTTGTKKADIWRGPPPTQFAARLAPKLDKETKGVSANGPAPGPAPDWGEFVRSIEPGEDDGVSLWLLDGSRLRYRSGQPWVHLPSPYAGEFRAHDILPLGRETALATTGRDVLVRIGSSDPVVSILLAGVGPGTAIDVEESGGQTVWWVAGHHGLLLRSTDHGQTWSPVPVRSRANFTAIDIVDKIVGWLGTDHGQLFSTGDGGSTWTSSQLPVFGRIFSIAFRDATKGVVAVENGQQYRTSDGGKTWNAMPVGEKEETVTALAWQPAYGFDAVTSRGYLYMSKTDGEKWEQNGMLDTTGIGYLRQNPEENTITHGWGEPVRAAPFGEKLVLKDSRRFLGVAFANDTKNGLGLGMDGKMWRTSNAGEKWELANSPSRVFWAPWYYLSWLAVGLCYWRALSPGSLPRPTLSSIAARAVPDAPIGSGDPDVLRLGEVARGLSRFFRNRSTVGPFTVAVVGEWGTGKTSFMRLLREDLEAHAVHPVWFNAWHQQGETHYLPVLLESIVAQAVPPIWEYMGWGFRLRLIRNRIWKSRIRIFVAALVFTFCYSVITKNDVARVVEWGNERVARVAELAGLREKGKSETAAKPPGNAGEAARTPGKGAADSVGKTIAVGGAAGSFLALLSLLFSTAKAFGVNPAELLVKAGGGRSRDAEARMSFQRRFARDFSEVTDALDAVPLVVFIDDLDRCRPEKTVEMLEAVNYLISSGACFVVMGLARRQVEACVSLGYKEVANEIAGAPAAGNPEPSNPMEQRARFARQYLDKLVNLEIPIPVPSRAQRAELLVGQIKRAKESEGAKPKKWQQWLHANILTRVSPLKRSAITAMLCVCLFALAWLLGQKLHPGGISGTGPGVEPAATAAVGAANIRNDLPDPRAKTPENSSAPRLVYPSPALYHAGRDSGFGLIGAVAVVALVSFLGLAAQRGERVTTDSPKFEQALEDWTKVIELSHSTPRALKRFVNRLRYLAMQQMTEPPPLSMQDKFVGWLSRRICRIESPVPPVVERISEDILVALAAIEAFGIVHRRAQVYDEANMDEALAEVKEGTLKYPKAQLTLHIAAFEQLASRGNVRG